jgi:hypothetical protein
MNGILRIKSTLQPHFIIFPSHVRRTTNQVADMLTNFRVELEEGDFLCSPTSNPSHPTVIACRNIANTKDWPPDGVLRVQFVNKPWGGHLARQLATWCRSILSPHFRHLMDLNHLAATLQTSVEASLPHDLDVLLRGSLHGTVQDASSVTYAPPYWLS